MSSQAIRSTERSVSIARKVISARFPIGVGTKEILGAAGSAGMGKIYRSHYPAGRIERNEQIIWILSPDGTGKGVKRIWNRV